MTSQLKRLKLMRENSNVQRLQPNCVEITVVSSAVFKYACVCLVLNGEKKCSSGSNSSERRGKIGIASLVINPFMPFYPLIHFYAPLVF